MRRLVILFLVFTIMFPAVTVAYSTPPAAKEGLKTLLPQYETDPRNVELLIKIGICYHSLGGAGDAGAVIKSIDFFNKALRLEPKNNEIKAWLGSVTLIRARDVWVLEQPKYLSTGSVIMDAAVAAEPDNIDIRWIRVNTYSHLPSFLGKDSIVVSDLEFILGKMQGTGNKELLQDTYYRLGLAYKKVNNTAKAKENFNLAIELLPEAEIAHKIAKEEHL